MAAPDYVIVVIIGLCIWNAFDIWRLRNQVNKKDDDEDVNAEDGTYY